MKSNTDFMGPIQGRSKLDNWGGGADIHIYVFTHHKTINFKRN